MNDKVDRSLKIELSNLVNSLDDAFLKLEELDGPASKDDIKLLLRDLHSLKALLRMSQREAMSKVVHRLEDLVKHYVEKKGYVFDEEFLNIANSCLSYFSKFSKSLIGSKKFKENRKLENNLCERIVSVVGAGNVTDNSYDEGEIILDEEVAASIGVDVSDIKGSAIKEQANDDDDSDGFDDRVVYTSLGEIDQIVNLVEELSVNMEMVWYFKNKGELTSSQSLESLESAYKAMRKLQRDSLSLKMESLDSTFKSVKRVILETAKQLNKKVGVSFSGSEIKLENGQIDAIKSPLVHIVRNAVDHGLESSIEREGLNKDIKSHITLKASADKGVVSLSVKDDGKGIDKEKIKEKLVAKGIDASKLKESDVLGTIFESGFSTKDSVSETSGRGVGLDIVKSEISRIGGSVGVKTKLNEGTEFLLKIPSSTIIITCVIVKANNVIYAIPIDKVSHIIDINNFEERLYAEDNKAIIFEGEIVPLCNLGLNLHGSRNTDKKFNAGLVINNGYSKIIVQVDRIIDRQKIFMRKLNQSLETPDSIFRGVSILSNGEASLIIDPFAIFRHLENEITEIGDAA